MERWLKTWPQLHCGDLVRRAVNASSRFIFSSCVTTPVVQDSEKKKEAVVLFV